MYSRVTVEKLEMALRYEFDPEVLRNAHLEIFKDQLRDNIVIEYRKFLASKHYSDSIEDSVLVPRDWWESFKERWFTQKMQSRWPVPYREIITSKTIKMTKVCPHLDLPKDNRSHLEFLMLPSLKEAWEYEEDPFKEKVIDIR